MERDKMGLRSAVRARRFRVTVGVFAVLGMLVMPISDSAAAAAYSIPALGSAPKSSQPVWVALEDARQVARVNVRTGKVTRRLAVPGQPHNIVVNDAGTVASALWSERRIVVIRRKVKPVKLGGAPHDVKMGGGRIVVANQGSHRLQLVSLRGKRRGRILLRASPHDLAITPDGSGRG
jgi:hypothetical protein